MRSRRSRMATRCCSTYVSESDDGRAGAEPTRTSFVRASQTGGAGAPCGRIDSRTGDAGGPHERWHGVPRNREPDGHPRRGLHRTRPTPPRLYGLWMTFDEEVFFRRRPGLYAYSPPRRRAVCLGCEQTARDERKKPSEGRWRGRGGSGIWAPRLPHDGGCVGELIGPSAIPSFTRHLRPHFQSCLHVSPPRSLGPTGPRTITRAAATTKYTGH